MVGIWVVLGAIVTQFVCSLVPVVSELIFMSIILLRRGTIVLLVTPAAVELSVWIGLFGWGQPMLIRV